MLNVAYKFYNGTDYIKNGDQLSGLRNNECEHVGGDEFSCFEKDPQFAILTLLFIYLPSIQIFKSIFHGEAAELIITAWGCIFFGIGLLLPMASSDGFIHMAAVAIGILGICGMFYGYFPSLGNESWTLSTLCSKLISLPKICWTKLTNVAQNWTMFLSYPLILLLSPALVLLIKLRTILPHNTHLGKQKQGLNLGESSLEAAPQLALQVYIILTRADRWPTNFQLAAMFASLASLALPSIEIFLTSRHEDTGMKNKAKYWPVFFTNTVFRVFSLGIITSVVKYWAFSIWVLNYNWILLEMIFSQFFLRYCCRRKTNDNRRRGVDSCMLSPLTVTNLENNSTDLRYRRFFAYWIFALYTLVLLGMLVLCNLGLELTLPLLDWKIVGKVENIFLLNTLIVTTLCLGVVSLVLDTGRFYCWQYDSVFGRTSSHEDSDSVSDIEKADGTDFADDLQMDQVEAGRGR